MPLTPDTGTADLSASFFYYKMNASPLEKRGNSKKEKQEERLHAQITFAPFLPSGLD
jgi:hypothetical protein